MTRSRRVFSVTLPLFASIAACSAGAADSDGPTAEARVAITTVPSDVGCARITATGDRTVSQDFAVTPGASAHLALPGVPAGAVQFSATAFRDACPIAANAVPTWVTSTPTSLTVTSGTAVDVTINLVPNASGNVTLNFGDGGTTAPACTSPIAATAHAVTSSIGLPILASDIAYDVDGSGTAENRYGAFTSSLTAQGFNASGVMTDAIAHGNAILLFDEAAADATFTNDPACASVKLSDAVPNGTPSFTGTGHFVADPAVPPVVLGGVIQAGAFASRAAVVGAEPPRTFVELPFASVMVKVPLTVLHVALTNASAAVTKGQVNGVIKATDIQSIVIPAIASGLNAQVRANPASATSQHLLDVFDIGGCGGLNSTKDGTISTCEVAQSALIANVLSPDVKVFDANGAYAPTPNAAAAARDAFSVGFRFTSVKYVP